jgi:DNA-binding response OmpR family regulator
VTPAKANGTPATVWIVDDEWVIATTLAAFLRQSGFDVTIFFSPLETLKAAENTCPDILISDVMMPEMSGIDLGVCIKSTYPTCRVLLFSGQTYSSDMLSRARVDGHDFQFLTKPVHPIKLLAVLRHDVR